MNVITLVDARAVDAGLLEQTAVVREVGPDRADQQRRLAKQTEGVGDVARDPAPFDDEVVDEKAQRHPLKLLSLFRGVDMGSWDAAEKLQWVITTKKSS